MRLQQVASRQLWAWPCRDIYGSHRFWDPTRKNNNPTFIASHIPQLRKLLLGSDDVHAAGDGDNTAVPEKGLS
jgi:hypothetical protein